MWNNIIGAIEVNTGLVKKNKRKIRRMINKRMKEFKKDMYVYVNVMCGFQADALITFSTDLKCCKSEEEGLKIVQKIVNRLDRDFVITKVAAAINNKPLTIDDI